MFVSPPGTASMAPLMAACPVQQKPENSKLSKVTNDNVPPTLNDTWELLLAWAQLAGNPEPDQRGLSPVKIGLANELPPNQV